MHEALTIAAFTFNALALLYLGGEVVHLRRQLVDVNDKLWDVSNDVNYVAHVVREARGK